MTLYEVAVKTVSEVFYLVEAKNADEAREKFATGTENGEFVETEDVVSVNEYDARFDEYELAEIDV